MTLHLKYLVVTLGLATGGRRLWRDTHNNAHERAAPAGHRYCSRGAGDRRAADSHHRAAPTATTCSGGANSDERPCPDLPHRDQTGRGRNRRAADARAGRQHAGCRSPMPSAPCSSRNRSACA